jgi:cytochrome c-type biogenesis protein CcmH/NrfG
MEVTSMKSVWRSRVFFAPALIGAFLCLFQFQCLLAKTSDDPIVTALETARRTGDESKLQTLKARLQQRISQNMNDAQAYYLLAQVEGYLVDVFGKDKKAAEASIDRAIAAVQHSIQLNDKSSDAHSLLADLYGRKIGFGGAFAGPRFGPKVGDENKRAMALDDKNPRVWASLGRQYLMAPKMFGGDIGKAIESLQKSLERDPSQDETWVWLAKAFQKQGEKTKARDAVGHALQLNPESAFAKSVAATIKD